MLCPFCKKEISSSARRCCYCQGIIVERVAGANIKRGNSLKKFLNKIKIFFLRLIWRLSSIISTRLIKASFFIGLVLLVIILIVVSGNRFPKPNDPREITFNWTYKGSPYTINETLYKSIYHYYNSLPKKYTCEESACPPDMTEAALKMFLYTNPKDDTISQLASEIQALGRVHGLSDDEIAELVVSFVQSIPYDFGRAESAKPEPKYAYETLYDDIGLCSDKSFLAALLIQKIGYGVALFDYEAGKHLAIGIKCPSNYSSYQSNYCYTELTDKFDIGIMPEQIDPNNGLTARRSIIALEDQGSNGNNLISLESPRIYQVADGRVYEKIIDTMKIIDEINSLKNEINILSPQIEQQKETLSSMSNDLDQLKEEGSYQKYNLLVDKYNNLARKLKVGVETYNQKVNLYNSLINN